jgi:hypothetical protein
VGRRTVSPTRTTPAVWRPPANGISPLAAMAVMVTRRRDPAWTYARTRRRTIIRVIDA